MMIVEKDAAIFRGTVYYWPTEIWSVKEQEWKPYKGDVPKEAGWGDIITLEQAKEFMEPL